METRSAQSERPTDAELMVRTAGGDLEGFAVLVDRYHGRAFGFACRLLGDPDEARDIVQEGFLRLLRGASRYEARASLVAYLFTILRNLIRSSRRRRLEAPLEWDQATSRVRGAIDRSDLDLRDPVAALFEADRHASIERAIASLPDPLREVFILSEMEGLSYMEIGRICRCPIGTVASRKHAAVERLRTDLAPLRNGSSR